MSIESLKIGDGESSETFTALEGLQVTALALSSTATQANTLSSGAWETLLAAGGIQSLSLTASGQVEASDATTLLRSYALSSGLHNYELHFDNGDMLSGAFLITRYNRSSSTGGVEELSLTLQSSGTVTHTEA